MSNVLTAENYQLRQQLDNLIEQARRNQEIMQRHQTFDLAFISAGNFDELFHSIFQTLTKSCELDVTSLVLIDPDYQIRRILIELQINLNAFPNLRFFQDESELGELLASLQRPVLERYSAQRHGPVFPQPIQVAASVAIVPLRRNGKLIGCLNLGSFHEDRFAPNMATDFIERLASIVAICVENVINHERLKHIGLTDPLTGIHNRRYVDQRLLEEIGRSRRQGYALSCMYIDIDHFKQINDKVGHYGGDEVLREVAARIQAELRSSDALGRFGGEEFVVLLIDAELEAAIQVAERIRASVAGQALLLETGETVSFTVSIGVASLSAPDLSVTDEMTAKNFIGSADHALYQAKTSGRNKVIRAGEEI